MADIYSNPELYDAIHKDINSDKELTIILFSTYRMTVWLKRDQQ